MKKETTKGSNTTKNMASAVASFGSDFFGISRGYTYQEKEIDGIATWGKNNDYPEKVKRLTRDSPFHSKLVKRTTEFIKGQGLVLINPAGNESEITRPADVLTGETWAQVDDRVSNDVKLLNGYSLRIIWSLDRNSIASVSHIPLENVRVGLMDEFGRINDFYVSDNWGKGYHANKKEKAEFIPRFNPSKRHDEPMQLLYIAAANPYSRYYPEPGYSGIIDNILIDKLLNKHKVSFIRNGINAANVIQLVTDMDDKNFQQFVNKFDSNLSGAANSGKNAYLKVPTGQTNFHQITNPNTKNAAGAFDTYFEQNRDVIFMGHDAIYKDIFGFESNQASLAADRVVEKTVMYNNIVIKPFQKLKEYGYNQLAPYIFGDFTIYTKPTMLFEGLQEARQQLAITNNEEQL